MPVLKLTHVSKMGTGCYEQIQFYGINDARIWYIITNYWNLNSHEFKSRVKYRIIQIWN